MFRATHLIGFGVRRVLADAVVAFASSATSPTDLSSYTLALTGMTTTGKRIAVLFGNGAALRTITAVTIDGVAAQEIAKFNNGARVVAMWGAVATGNAAGNVVVTLDGVWTECSCGIWNASNLYSFSPTSQNTDTANNPTAVTVLKGGAVFTAANNLSGTVPEYSNWGTGLTEGMDILGGSPGVAQHGSAAGAFAAAGTVTANPTLAFAANNFAMLVVALR